MIICQCSINDYDDFETREGLGRLKSTLVLLRSDLSFVLASMTNKSALVTYQSFTRNSFYFYYNIDVYEAYVK